MAWYEVISASENDLDNEFNIIFMINTYKFHKTPEEEKEIIKLGDIIKENMIVEENQFEKLKNYP